MKAKHLFPLVLLALGATLRAQAPAASPVTQAAPPPIFETAGYVDATLFVPAEKMNGSLHSVGVQAWNDGLQNSYQLTSGGQTTWVTGTPLLLQRINEIYAVDYLNSLSKTQEFTDALAKSVSAKVDSVVNVVNDPFGTARNLPRGASRFFGGLGEALKGGGNSGGNAVNQLTGFDKAKAALALKLGVSPYTDNAQLQESLTSTARVIAAGGLVVTVAGTAATGGAGAALMVIGVNQTLQDALVNKSAEQLRIGNRQKLAGLGVDRDLVDEFITHPDYNPWVTTIIVDALGRIGVNPGAFIKEACKASNRADAFYFQRLAQLLLQYHTASPLVSIRNTGGLVTGLDKGGTLVIPVSLDYAIWSGRIASRTDQFVGFLPGNKEFKALALWTDGQLSPRLDEELTKRSISWKALALVINPKISNK